MGTPNEIKWNDDNSRVSKHLLDLLCGSCHFSSRNICASEHWWNWLGRWHTGVSMCVCARVCVRHWVVLLLESHWRAVKVLCVAEGIIVVQVYACKPSKQSAGCERRVMHHWPRNTNIELCFVCSPLSLLVLSAFVCSRVLLPCKFRRLEIFRLW